MKHRVLTKSQCDIRPSRIHKPKRFYEFTVPFIHHTMNKAPSLGKGVFASPTSPSTSNPRNPSRRDSQDQLRSTTTSTSSKSSKPLDGTQSDISDTNSRTTISGDHGQHRMVVAIDYGTTFSGKHEETLRKT